MKKMAYASLVGLALVLAVLNVARADTDPPKAWQEVRALVVRFNDAQNAHNPDVVGALLLNSPDFALSVGPDQIRGHDAAVSRLGALYQNLSLSVLPDYGALDIQLAGSNEANVTMPTQFRTSVPGGDTVMTQSVVHERVVKTQQGWRIASMTADPAPATP